MGKIITTDENRGEDMFFNLSIKTYLQEQGNNTTDDTKKLKNCIYNEKVKVYLAAIDENNKVELIAINNEGKKQCFVLDCDSNLSVLNVTKTKLENLSKESQDFFEDLQSKQSAHIRPLSQ